MVNMGMGGGASLAFRLSKNNHHPLPEGEEVFSAEHQSSFFTFPPCTGQLYVYCMKMQIFLQNVGAKRLMNQEGGTIFYFLDICCLYSRHASNEEFRVINKGRISLI